MMKFDAEPSLDEFKFIDSRLFVLIARMSEFLLGKKIPFYITSILRSRYDGISKSGTHQRGAAIDVSTKYWTTENKQDVDRWLVDYQKIHNIGAISSETGKVRLHLYHGTGSHLHIQVRKN
jgi:hypothetical protein